MTLNNESVRSVEELIDSLNEMLAEARRGVNSEGLSLPQQFPGSENTTTPEDTPVSSPVGSRTVVSAAFFRPVGAAEKSPSSRQQRICSPMGPVTLHLDVVGDGGSFTAVHPFCKMCNSEIVSGGRCVQCGDCGSFSRRIFVFRDQ